jgi:hypothetical protein
MPYFARVIDDSSRIPSIRYVEGTFIVDHNQGGRAIRVFLEQTKIRKYSELKQDPPKIPFWKHPPKTAYRFLQMFPETPVMDCEHNTFLFSPLFRADPLHVRGILWMPSNRFWKMGGEEFGALSTTVAIKHAKQRRGVGVG